MSVFNFPRACTPLSLSQASSHSPRFVFLHVDSSGEIYLVCSDTYQQAGLRPYGHNIQTTRSFSPRVIAKQHDWFAMAQWLSVCVFVPYNLVLTFAGFFIWQAGRADTAVVCFKRQMALVHEVTHTSSMHRKVRNWNPTAKASFLKSGCTSCLHDLAGSVLIPTYSSSVHPQGN
jgi:hypothetical protein